MSFKIKGKQRIFTFLHGKEIEKNEELKSYKPTRTIKKSENPNNFLNIIFEIQKIKSMKGLQGGKLKAIFL